MLRILDKERLIAIQNDRVVFNILKPRKPHPLRSSESGGNELHVVDFGGDESITIDIFHDKLSKVLFSGKNICSFFTVTKREARYLLSKIIESGIAK